MRAVCYNPTGDDPFKDMDWTSYGILQDPKTTDREKLSRGLLRNHHPAKPLYAQETLWPGNKYHPQYTADDIRKNAYVMMMSAAAINVGGAFPDIQIDGQGDPDNGMQDDPVIVVGRLLSEGTVTGP